LNRWPLLSCCGIRAEKDYLQIAVNGADAKRLFLLAFLEKCSEMQEKTGQNRQTKQTTKKATVVTQMARIVVTKRRRTIAQ
jgi:hypothetical protein